MSIERLVESLGMTAPELKTYVLSELDEFLAAEEPKHQAEEFGDVLFALVAMGWAHTGRHLPVSREAFERKVEERLRGHATLTRHGRRYHDDRIRDLEFGVVHFAAGNFGGQWARFDALQNGTVAEIALLTDAPFAQLGELTNHCIITFGGNDAIEYDILSSSGSMAGGNTIRCRVPDFMFKEAKRRLNFSEVADYLTLQVLAGLEGLRFVPGATAHFHSWENGFLVESSEFAAFLNSFKTIFSPYLTIGRLRSLVDEAGGSGWTMTPEELKVATEYEHKLTTACMRVVVESTRDRDFYSTWVHSDRIDVRSFAGERSTAFDSSPSDPLHLSFIAGGRPVREKGFLELCQEMAPVREWCAERGIAVSLAILCREQRREKGAEYIGAVEAEVARLELDDVVTIEPKVSLDELRRRIADSSGILVPSLYDPFCLMPTYGIEVERPSFVSCQAGVSENLRSREFVFDPEAPGDLLRAISRWYETRPDFVFEARFPSYLDMYLFKERVQGWG